MKRHHEYLLALAITTMLAACSTPKAEQAAERKEQLSVIIERDCEQSVDHFQELMCCRGWAECSPEERAKCKK